MKQKIKTIVQKKPNKWLVLILALIASLPTVLGIVHKIFTGDIAFWYDPARDLLSGLANIHKITLIGPTSGIPGIFYGPYWIWLLSLGQLFSPDPRIVTAVALTIPYLIIFPFILSRFSKVFSRPVQAMLWIFFLTGFTNYFTDLWNPHPAPLLILLAIYFQFSRSNQISRKNLLLTLLAGFFAGLVMNFQLSFGIGMMFGLFIFMIIVQCISIIHAKTKKQAILHAILLVGIFLIGWGISFCPFLLFEMRHHFEQTKTFLNAIIHYGGVVSLTGLTKIQILQLFFARFSQILHTSFTTTAVLFILGIMFYGFTFRKKKHNTQELRLLGIITSIAAGVLSIYLTAKNPIWAYHFIGVEVLFLLLIGIVINKSTVLKVLTGLWIIAIVWNSTIHLQVALKNDPMRIYGNLLPEEKTVQTIQQKANNQKYVVFAYSPSIYTYEYAYLFQWLFHKDVPYRPELNPTNAPTVFLIIPPNTKSSIKQDFINFRTPPMHYNTVANWIEPDGTLILRRQRTK